MSTMDPVTGEVLDEFEEFSGERIEEHFDTMIAMLKRSPATMIMDFGSTSPPYLTKGACQMLMRAFRVSVVGAVRRSMDRVEGPNGEVICIFRCEGEFEVDGLRFPVVGTCATDEKFIAGIKKDGTRFKTWGTVCRDADAFAGTRLANAAARAGCMVGALTWDDLERGGIPRSSVGQKTEGQSGGGAQGHNNNGGNGAAPAKRATKIPPLGQHSPNGYLWTTYGNRWDGLGETWRMLGDASKKATGTQWKADQLKAASDADKQRVAEEMSRMFGDPALAHVQALGKDGEKPQQAATTTAAPAEQKPAEPHGPPMTPEQKLHIARLCDALKLSREDKQRVITDALGRPMQHGETLSRDVASSIIGALMADCMDAKINIDQPAAVESPF